MPEKSSGADLRACWSMELLFTRRTVWCLKKQGGEVCELLRPVALPSISKLVQ